MSTVPPTSVKDSADDNRNSNIAAGPGMNATRAATILAWGGALSIAIGTFLHWGLARPALDDGLPWLITGDAFPHGYLFLILAAAAVILLGLQHKGITRIDLSWWLAIATAVIVCGDAINFLVEIEFDAKFTGPGITTSSIGAIAHLVGVSMKRSQDH